jgi:cell division protein FtsQ
VSPTGTTQRRRPPAAPVERPGRGPHPRVSERRRAVSRQLGRRRFVVLCVLAALVTLGALAWPLAHSRFFSARVVVVSGAHETPVADVLDAAGLANDPPMIDVRAGVAARAIEALPWVNRATVSLEWPDGVHIAISERRAVCAVAHGAGWLEIDRSGRVLAGVRAAPAGLVEAALPGPLAVPGHDVGPGSRAALAVAATLPPVLLTRVTLVEARRGGTVELTLAGGIQVILGSASQLGAKYEDVAAIEAGAPPGAGSVIDVSVPETPTVSAK